jgi:hypothetical protein
MVPAFGKPSEYDVESSNKESCDILNDDEAGSQLANESQVLEPETAASTFEASAFAGEGEVLTGAPAADDVNRFRVSMIHLPHIRVLPHTGPVPREVRSSGVVNLTLPHDVPDAGPLEAEL